MEPPAYAGKAASVAAVQDDRAATTDPAVDRTKGKPSRSRWSVASLLGVLAKVPLVGDKLLKAAINRSHQSFKCPGCGTISKIPMKECLAADLTGLVLKDGAVEELVAVSPPPSPTKPTGHNRLSLFSPRRRKAKAVAAAAAAAAAAKSEAPAAPTVPVCSECPGRPRLGVYTYPGDSCHGDKQEFVKLAKMLIRVRPKMCALPPTVDPNLLRVDHVEWCD